MAIRWRRRADAGRSRARRALLAAGGLAKRRLRQAVGLADGAGSRFMDHVDRVGGEDLAIAACAPRVHARQLRRSRRRARAQSASGTCRGPGACRVSVRQNASRRTDTIAHRVRRYAGVGGAGSGGRLLLWPQAARMKPKGHPIHRRLPSTPHLRLGVTPSRGVRDGIMTAANPNCQRTPQSRHPATLPPNSRSPT